MQSGFMWPYFHISVLNQSGLNLLVSNKQTAWAGVHIYYSAMKNIAHSETIKFIYSSLIYLFSLQLAFLLPHMLHGGTGISTYKSHKNACQLCNSNKPINFYYKTYIKIITYCTDAHVTQQMQKSICFGVKEACTH